MEPHAQAGTPANRRKILVVDDNADAADTLAMLLDYLAYETRTAYNGREAVMTAEDWQPDLVILDINMPVMNGYEAARELRCANRLPRVVLVALTAQTSKADQALAEAAGFDLHLSKPVDGGELANVVDRVLRS